MSDVTMVLFDLDGTLLDTAPDMAHALNSLRDEHDLPHLSLDAIRPHVGYGSKALLKLGFNADEQDAQYASLLSTFFSNYEKCLARSTVLFPGMSEVLTHLEDSNIPWGIVTNKPARFTHDLLDALDLSRRSDCTICGDTLEKRKPHPEPILYACHLLQQPPANTVYIGDAPTDIIASKAAGVRSLAALYGYISKDEDPYAWKADGYIKTPTDIISWLK